MKLNLTVFVLLFLYCVNLYSQDKKIRPADYPNLEISEQTWDFGTVTQGEQIRHSFILKNTGTQNLIIKKVKSTCGCTVTEITKKSLKPKESSKLFAVFKSFGKKGKQLKKYISKPMIRSNR
ncbi:DUF1573 domain-containing protein [bacterium]|nr:DUF1573 domain-containing protein [bacterium]